MSKVDELIAQGAVQKSRNHRQVFVPPGEPSKYVREHYPELYDLLVTECLRRFEAECRSAVWTREGSHIVQLTPAEFSEFKLKTTGKEPWSPEGKEPCSGCGSLGHMHRRDCPMLKGNE